jgi:hypothetical protein
MKFNLILTKSLILLLLVNILSTCVISEETNITIYVDDDNNNGPWDGSLEHPYLTIKDAINASKDYDTIFVFNGVYIEELEIEKPLKIIGESRNNTIISSDKTTIITINSKNVNFSEFTIKVRVSGIRINGIESNIENITIMNNIFEVGNGGNTNGGIFISKINNCTIKYNKFLINSNYTSCSGISILGSTNCTIQNNNITSNMHPYRLGIGIEIRSGGIYGISKYNDIKNNNFQKLKTGIIVAESYNNKIEFNNIWENPVDAFFINSFNNIWNYNYWGKANINLKTIFGLLIIPYTPFCIPLVKIDFHPAREPYNIN